MLCGHFDGKVSWGLIKVAFYESAPKVAVNRTEQCSVFCMSDSTLVSNFGSHAEQLGQNKEYLVISLF